MSLDNFQKCKECPTGPGKELSFCADCWPKLQAALNQFGADNGAKVKYDIRKPKTSATRSTQS